MSLASGARLGPYEIAAPLGAGGMGDVYKAVDTRLARMVAIKILKGPFTDRFEREAKAISALNHANICTLYDLGTEDGTSYLVMEYLEGKPLQGPLPWTEARTYALQLLDALETAHRAGIVHRDVKPANIVLTKAGIKLLDFGLAKSRPVTLAPTDETQTNGGTAEGTIQGTPHYMAPEQAAGEIVDARADIFAFGAVLYELLTGQRAFQGPNSASIIGAVMKDDPLTIAQLPDTVPIGVTKILRRCLAKDRERRYQSARDVALDLEETAFPVVQPTSRRNLLIGTSAAFAAGLGVERLRESRNGVAPVARSHHLTVPIPRGHLLNENTPSISPDGRMIIFRTIDEQGRRVRWLHTLDQDDPRPLPEVATVSPLVWSPDSQQIAITTDQSILRLRLAANALETITNFSTATGVNWYGGDVLLLVRRQSVYRLSARGGEAVPLNLSVQGLRFLPGTRHFLFYRSQTQANRDYFAATFDGKVVTKVLSGVDSVRYGGGYLFYTDPENRLRARPFDPERLAFTGDAVPIVDLQSGSYTVSQGRDIAYAQSGNHSEWRQHSRNSSVALSLEAGGSHPEYSADGKRILFNATSGDIWILDQERGGKTRLTFNGGGVPVWSHDESRIYYSGGNDSVAGIYSLPVSGGRKPELIALGRTHHLAASPDGKFVAATLPSGGKFHLVAVSLSDKKLHPLTEQEFFYDHPQFSPDSKWLTYCSDETGRLENYLMPFPGGGAKWPISTGGGGQCRWRSDGKELYYPDLAGDLYALDVDLSGAQPKLGRPHKIIELHGPISGTARFAATSDGKQFLFQVRQPQSRPGSIHIITNWRPTSAPSSA